MFNIEMTRTPYFFKNRSKTVSVNGSTRKIFHITRAHKRIGAGGRETFVKSHFRGERKFMWKGYDVQITMPGLHHKPIQEFSAPARFGDGRRKKGEMYLDELGSRLREVMAR